MRRKGNSEDARRRGNRGGGGGVEALNIQLSGDDIRR